MDYQDYQDNPDYQDYLDYQDNNSTFNHSYDYTLYPSLCDKEAVRSFAGLFLPVIYGLVLVVGLAGNTLVVVVYSFPRRLRTLTDACILNLAVSDLLLLSTLPVWAADAVHGWTLGQAACKVTSFLYSTNFSCGMLLLACISIDRYCAVAHNASGRTWTHPRARMRWLLVCVCVWGVACLLGLPDLVFFHVRPTHHRLSCRAIYPPSMARPAKAALELLEVSLRFLLPFSVMAVCYTRVGRALSWAAGVQRQRKWPGLRVLLAVVAVFLLTQLPYNVVKLWRALDLIYALVTDCHASKALDHASQVAESLALGHACINPFLYGFMGSSFRANVLRAAKWLGQRVGQRRRPDRQRPAVEIALRSPDQTRSRSASEEVGGEEDTSTFTI